MADNSASPSGATSGETDTSESVAEYVTKTELNAMLNGFRKSFKKDFEDIRTSFASSQPSKEEPTPRLPKSEADAALLDLRKQVEVLQTREKEKEAQLLEQNLHSTLRDQLTQHGVAPQFVKHAIAYLNQEKLVKRDEDGSIKMRVNKVDYDLDDALKQWSKTDEAKLYMAPKGTQGSGQSGPVRAGAKQPADARAAQLKAFDNLIADALPGLLGA